MPLYTNKVFISATTSDLRTFRKAVRDALDAKGVVVDWQDSFAPDARTVPEMLREKLKTSDIVIHLAGFACGARPKAPLEGWGRPSYTQLEYGLARQMGKTVYTFVATDPGQLDALPAEEDSELRELQMAHRKHLLEGDAHLRYRFATRDELVHQIARIAIERPEAPSKCANLPGTIGNLFKGRAEFLQKLRTALEAASEGHATAIHTPRAIHGLGGVGKTRAAVEYGYRHWDDYTALLLVRADSPEALRRNLADLTGAVVADLKDYTGSDQETRLAAVLRWLAQHPRWFLILDNVDTKAAASEVEDLLARLRGGHVLITSRLRNWSNQVEPLELELLDEAAAVAFLEESTRQRARTANDAQDARALAEALDGLALALQQASAYINSEAISFGEYLSTWRETRQGVLEWFDEQLMLKYPASVAITWQTTFDQLEGPARALLGLLSHFASAPIPRRVLKTKESALILTAALATTPGGSVSDPQPPSPLAGNRALVELGKFSLVRFLQTPRDTFSLHRLVQEVARYRLGEAARLRGEQALALVQACAPGDARDASTWPQWAALAPHLESLFETAKGTDHPQTASLLSGFAGYLGYRGAAPATAVGYYERALALHRQLGDRRAEGEALTGLAYCRYFLGNDNAQARDHFLQAVEIHSAMGDRREEGDARCGLGYVHCALSNYTEALAEFERARDIHRQIGNSRGEGEALAGMGAPLFDSGRLKDAEEVYQKSVSIHRAAQDIQGETEALGGLGWCCWGQSKHRQAIGYFEKALATYREMDYRQGIIANLCGLGDAWTSLGDVDRGTAFLREALELCRESNDDWEGSCLWGLAIASQQAGDHQAAVGILEPNLKLMRERDDQRGIACDLNWLGESYIKLGEVVLARAYFEEALTIGRAIDDRWSEAFSLHGLGRLDKLAGEASLAVTRYERALEVIRSVNDIERERDILRDLGEAFAALGQTERAADCLAQAERLSRQLEEWNRSPDH